MKKYGTYSFKGTAAELIAEAKKNKEMLVRANWTKHTVADFDPTNPNSKLRYTLGGKK